MGARLFEVARTFADRGVVGGVRSLERVLIIRSYPACNAAVLAVVAIVFCRSSKLMVLFGLVSSERGLFEISEASVRNVLNDVLTIIPKFGIAYRLAITQLAPRGSRSRESGIKFEGYSKRASVYIWIFK